MVVKLLGKAACEFSVVDEPRGRLELARLVSTLGSKARLVDHTIRVWG